MPVIEARAFLARAMEKTDKSRLAARDPSTSVGMTEKTFGNTDKTDSQKNHELEACAIFSEPSLNVIPNGVCGVRNPNDVRTPIFGAPSSSGMLLRLGQNRAGMRSTDRCAHSAGIPRLRFGMTLVERPNVETPGTGFQPVISGIPQNPGTTGWKACPTQPTVN